MNAPQFKIGDTVVATSQDVEQTKPLKIVDTQYRNDDVYYKLDEESPAYWKDIMPGDSVTWALVHLRLGFSVIPIEAGGKRPPISGYAQNGNELRYSWKKYQTQHTLETTILSWAQRWPNMNHAIVSGAVSGVVVLDIDSPVGEKYAKEHGLPETPTATSGNGKHYYFRHPGGTVKNLVRPAGGLDLKADGGYVIAPGSFHGERQVTYRWLVPPWECEFADMPEWLLELTKEPERQTTRKEAVRSDNAYAEAALEGELGRLARTAEGTRNDQLNKSAFALGQLVAAGALDETEVHNSLSRVAQMIGLSERESGATISSGLESGKSEPRQIPEREGLPELPDEKEVNAMEALAELKRRHEDYLMSLIRNPRAKEPDWFELLKEIIVKARMTESEVDTFIAEVEAAPALLKRKKTALKNEWRKAQKTDAAKQILNAANIERPPTWPYDVRRGRLVHLSEKLVYNDAPVIAANPIADFAATISHEITKENRERLFVIDGNAIRGGPFTLEISAKEFGSDYKLRAELDAASGSLDPVRARMGNHLGPAIKLLTKQSECKKIQRYERTGWTDKGFFLIPGRPRRGVEVVLDDGLVYRVNDGDLSMGLDALDALLKSMGPERSTVVASLAFQAPLSRLADWGSERYAVFVAGRTGTLKTSFSKVLMCLYGSKFIEDRYIQKWGDGATANARITIASAAHDLPLLIDNYKPGIGGGAKAFIAFIHNIIEGSEKRRLNRSSSLRKNRPLQCWPICTGEDVPDGDPASLARILVVTFTWQTGEPNLELTKAHNFSKHLPVVGNAWIAWLETDDGRHTVERIASKFLDLRTGWAAVLRGIRKDSVNVLRVASNLATNQLSWEILCEHPTIGQVAREYKEKHLWGLHENVAITMAEATAEALEATRYIAALKELLATRRAVIYDTNEYLTDYDRDKVIGWRDKSGVYLLPAVARKAAEVLVSDAFNGISSLAMNKQLYALGLIASSKKGQYTKPKRIGESIERVLHLVSNVFDSEEDEDDEIPM